LTIASGFTLPRRAWWNGFDYTPQYRPVYALHRPTRLHGTIGSCSRFTGLSRLTGGA
jgi:hypothetical protein